METKEQNKSETSQFYRFQVFTLEAEKKKTVGVAYLKDGQSLYSLRLWTLLNEKYFILPRKENPAQLLIMTREESRKQSGNKYFWNIVGHGNVNSVKGVIELEFDLLEKKLLMSLFPDSNSAHVSNEVKQTLQVAA